MVAISSADRVTMDLMGDDFPITSSHFSPQSPSGLRGNETLARSAGTPDFISSHGSVVLMELCEAKKDHESH